MGWGAMCAAHYRIVILCFRPRYAMRTYRDEATQGAVARYFIGGNHLLHTRNVIICVNVSCLLVI